MRTTGLSNLFKLTVAINLLWACGQTLASPNVNGNVIEVPDDGWYQVQRADNFDSICEGQRSCEVTPGDYIVINHTTGERFNVSVSGDQGSVASISVSGNTISWPDDGWYQVQTATTYESLCEGGRSCNVPDGEYIVINHTTGARETLTVDGTTTTPDTVVQIDPNELVSVVGNTIYWRDDGWYQVQNANTFESLCEGERTCTVANGTYIVINHTTGQRDNNVIVADDSTIISPEITPPEFDLLAPQIMPANCIGSLDSQNTRFCVNPDTRLFSATREDGSVQWSYTLPGSNSTNQIETVLTTDQWLIIVADKFPELDEFTLDQRSNQYEASLFNKNGAFIRTVPLTFNLRRNNPIEIARVNSRYSSGAFNNPLPAIATETDAGNPLLIVGWNRWRTSSLVNRWDMGGVARFDLAEGTSLGAMVFPDNGISQLSLIKADRDMLRIVSDSFTILTYVDGLGSIHPSHFSQFIKDATIRAPGSVDSQLNGSNYRDVINLVLPWINGDVANETLFGSVTDEPPGSFSIPFNEFSLLLQSEDDNYVNNTYQCANDGELLNRPHRFVSIEMNVFDHCAFSGKTHNGKLLANYVGRDEFGVRGENLTLFRDDVSATTVNIGHSVSYSRVLSGSSRGYFGSMVGYGESEYGNNVSVTGYSSNARFFYGRDIGGHVCDTQVDNNGVRVSQLLCQRNTAEGSITGRISLNAEWTTYSYLTVDTNLNFGQPFFTDFSWVSTDGSTLPDPIPFDGRTEPLKDFYFESGSIKITAQDRSRIELTPIAQAGEPAFNVNIYDPNGNDLGNFPMEFINVKCVERLGGCTVP